MAIELRQLTEMGFGEEVAKDAIKAHPNSFEMAIEYCINGFASLPLDSNRRSISPPRHNSPHRDIPSYDSVNEIPIRNLEGREKLNKLDQIMNLTADYSVREGLSREIDHSFTAVKNQNSFIDLTQERDYSPSPRESNDTDPDMYRALEESRKSHQAAFPNSTEHSSKYSNPYDPIFTPYVSPYPNSNFIGPSAPLLIRNGVIEDVTEEEAAVHKAIQASMEDTVQEITGHDMNQAFLPGARIENLQLPFERVRNSSTPVAIRTDSNQCTPLANYIQALYAVREWRKAIIECPLNLSNPPPLNFEGYWKGVQGNTTFEKPEQTRMFAFQNLFAFLSVTKRSFISLGPGFLNSIQCGGMEFADRKMWTERIQEIHINLISDIEILTKLEIQRIAREEKLSVEEVAARETVAISRFQASGRTIVNDQYISGPLNALSDAEKSSSHISILSVDIPSDTNSGNIYDALDRQFVIGKEDEVEQLQLFITLPTSLVLQIDRFNSRSNLTQSEKELDFNRERILVEIEKELFFDRYACSNRVIIAQGRKDLATSKKDIAALQVKLDQLDKNEQGEDSIKMVETSLAYFQTATSDNLERRARQERCVVFLTKALADLKSNIAEVKGMIAEAKKEAKAIFTPETFLKYGPFDLSGILMGTGLLGWSCNWAVIKSDDGKWYKSNDLTMIPVDIDEAIKDTSGLRMDNGLIYLFYQTPDLVEIEIPSPLVQAIELDNIGFAHQLPPSITAKWGYDLSEVEMHDIGPIESIDLISINSASQINLNLDSNTEMLDDDQVDEIQLDSPPDLPPSELNNPEEGKTLALRGGAIEELEFEEDDELDGMEEAEVELGCLAPIKSDWNVDLSVGKVGGKPVWIDPSSPLEFEDVACRACGNTMSFLLQMNSPDDDVEEAAARTLYIYSCRKSDCISSDLNTGMKVFRTQMSSPNQFYPHSLESIASRQEQELKLDPVTQLGGVVPTTRTDQPIWLESNIICEAEPYEESYLDDGRTANLEDDGEGDTEDSQAPDTAVGVDAPFLKFQERISRLPQQVLRFYRLPEVINPEPLWISSDRIKAVEVPLCELCSSTKAIEFQILSTILNHLEDSEFHFDSLLIYTCIKSCSIPRRSDSKTGWTEETILKQSFEKGGVKFGRV